MVETGGVSDPENAVGDGGKAIGPYQIHEVYWKDANSFDSSLGGTYQNCKGSGSFNYSERVMQVILFDFIVLPCIPDIVCGCSSYYKI